MAQPAPDRALVEDLETLLLHVDTLPARERDQLTLALLTEARARCARNGLFWLQYVKTRDEADPQAPIKPFPLHLAYLRELWGLLATHQRVVIAKSRQMLVSWIMAAYCVWVARYTPNQAIFWQSQQYDDAAMMVAMPGGGYAGRCQLIEETLPEWLKVPVRASEGKLHYANGSMIQALAGGADKVRGKVVSIYVGDEFARQEDQDGVYTAVSPLMQKGAKAIFVSTPNGAGNLFCTLYHGRPMGQAG